MYMYIIVHVYVCVHVCVCKGACTYIHAFVSVEVICMGIYKVFPMGYLGVEMGGGWTGWESNSQARWKQNHTSISEYALWFMYKCIRVCLSKEVKI